MPLQIIRQDITKIECDAIVNPSNENLTPGGGVDLAIHKKAGNELFEYCQKIGKCKIGGAVITPGANLQCKYVIHTAGPVWQKENKRECISLLESCYKESLKLAKEKECESVAIPLISSGLYGFPPEVSLKIATKVIQEFLFENEMLVYLVVYDKKSFAITEKIFCDIQELIDDAYVEDRTCAMLTDCELCRAESYPRQRRSLRSKALFDIVEPDGKVAHKQSSLEEMLTKMDDSFAVMLLKLIDIKGMTDVECYKRANVSKQTWYKIMNDKAYKPSKNTVVAFAIALRLTISETDKLLKSVGLSLSDSYKFDVIIKYFIMNEIYDIFEINEALFKFDQTGLGV